MSQEKKIILKRIEGGTEPAPRFRNAYQRQKGLSASFLTLISLVSLSYTKLTIQLQHIVLEHSVSHREENHHGKKNKSL